MYLKRAGTFYLAASYGFNTPLKETFSYDELKEEIDHISQKYHYLDISIIKENANTDPHINKLITTIGLPHLEGYFQAFRHGGRCA